MEKIKEKLNFANKNYKQETGVLQYTKSKEVVSRECSSTEFSQQTKQVRIILAQKQSSANNMLLSVSAPLVYTHRHRSTSSSPSPTYTQKSKLLALAFPFQLSNPALQLHEPAGISAESLPGQKKCPTRTEDSSRLQQP